ncbi:MAG TPA: hypothetical protein EYG79_10620 [Rhodobacteraceae bacterium]|nr:hypothetical protein [Paracoccaceae bacterium]
MPAVAGRSRENFVELNDAGMLMGAAVFLVDVESGKAFPEELMNLTLNQEAGKVFRFKEQEQLHEALIDDGIAKIYQVHLNVAETVAMEAGIEVVSELVAGKPYQAIKTYVEKVGASLLLVGRTGVHADEGLDMLLREDRIKELQESGVAWVGISADSLTPETHDDFRGKRGAWAKTMQGIDACKAAGMPFQIHFSATDETADRYRNGP